ncbi:hypothetical protein KCP77_22645 [Salmonella enterica subsp. enterica]|nr:hypothetical protein KCP77_22645 [Salmonella enterica subsp. enterica]
MRNSSVAPWKRAMARGWYASPYFRAANEHGKAAQIGCGALFRVRLAQQ